MYLQVLQNQWLMLAVLGGLGVLLAVVLGYLAMWQTRAKQLRGEVAHASVEPFWSWLRDFMPWLLILLLVGTALYGVLYVVRVATHPPNW